MKYALKKAMEKLTPRQQEFCRHWFTCFCAKEAARLAGMGSPGQYGPRLLKKKRISRVIFLMDQERNKKAEVSIEMFLEQLYYLSTREVGEFFDDDGKPIEPKDLPKRAAACVDGFTVFEKVDKKTGEVVSRKIDYKLSPKQPALDLVARHKGLIAAVKHQVQGEIKHTLDYEKLFSGDTNNKVLHLDPVEYMITHPEAEEPPPLADNAHIYNVDEMISDDQE